nr:unnamed protein product [Digitaria exilis]
MAAVVVVVPSSIWEEGPVALATKAGGPFSRVGGLGLIKRALLWCLGFGLFIFASQTCKFPGSDVTHCRTYGAQSVVPQPDGLSFPKASETSRQLGRGQTSPGAIRFPRLAPPFSVLASRLVLLDQCHSQ